MSENTKKTYVDLAADTLAGDLRDAMLTHIRSMQDPWSKLSEQKQQDKIYAVTNACETVVRRAVTLIAAHGQEIMHCKISKFTVKDEIKAELIAGSSVGNIERIAENIGQPAVMVFASPEAFLGQRAPVSAEPDQPNLPMEADADTAEGDDEQPTDPAAPELAIPPEEPGLSAFDQGAGAAEHGLSKSHNPFKEGDADWRSWNDGYDFTIEHPKPKTDDTVGQEADTESDQADTDGEDDDSGDMPDADPSDAPKAA